MDCAVEIDSDALIHIPRIIKTLSAIQKLIGGYKYRQTDRHTHTHSQKGDIISLFLFFRNKEITLNMHVSF
jgi:hypothetical protein